MATEPFRITRTNTRRYVGHCNLCAYATNVESVRVSVGIKLRDHARRQHGLTYVVETGDYRKDHGMKQPKKDLPEMEKLGDYDGHLVVFSGAREGVVEGTKFGDRNVVYALAYVYLNDQWKSLGETPIFWRTVCKQVLDAAPDEIGGTLTQGTDRNDREWFLAPVPASNKGDTKALAAWDKDHAAAF
jgi:hypothetical protein